MNVSVWSRIRATVSGLFQSALVTVDSPHFDTDAGKRDAVKTIKSLNRRDLRAVKRKAKKLAQKRNR